MRPYNQITIWDNKKRVEALNRFKILLVAYFQENKSRSDNELRATINRKKNQIFKIVIAAGISPGKMSGTHGSVITPNVNVIRNVFDLNKYGLNPIVAIDIIDEAAGVYLEDQKMATVRTFNPLFWFGLLVDKIATFPFILLFKLGFDSEKIEASMLGKFIKGVIQLVFFAASFLTALYYIGWLDSFKMALGEIFRR